MKKKESGELNKEITAPSDEIALPAKESAEENFAPEAEIAAEPAVEPAVEEKDAENSIETTEEIAIESAQAEASALSDEPAAEESAIENAQAEASALSDEAATQEIKAEESEETPSYGSPQSLYEDTIPAGFSLEDKKREQLAVEEEAEEEKLSLKEKEEEEKRFAKEAEEEEKRKAKEAKKKAKEDKKKAKTAALIAAVEAKAVQDAKKDIKRETGEDYEPFESISPETSEKTARDTEPQKSKSYSKMEKKLRKKYKLDGDVLLSGNDAVPGFIIAKGEKLIRTYNCLSSKKGDGTVCLTNRRLLINAGERSEINIDQVSGIKFSKFARFSVLKFFFGLLFLLLGAAMIVLPFIHGKVNIPAVTGSHWKTWFSYLFYGCGGVSVLISIPLLLSMIKKTFYFYVYARMEAPFLEYKGASYAKRERKGKICKYMVAKAGKESEKAARELGALILEVKDGRYDG